MPPAFYEIHPSLLRDAGLSGFGAPILDVGCGDNALWLRNLWQLGFDELWGVDPFIKEPRLEGVHLIRGEIAEFAAKLQGQFELVAFHHSLEHVADQLRTLQAAVRTLRVGGTCIIRIPVMPCEGWRLYGTDWVELDAPRHLYIHSRQSITSMALRAGLSLKSVSFDTTAFEFLGSEQYSRDIPLMHPDSLLNEGSSLFSKAEKKHFARLAQEANASGTGGRAIFVFRKESPL